MANPTSIDNFCKLVAINRHCIFYFHPNVATKVFPKGLDKLIAEASAAEITALVNKSKASRLEKLIKINKANIVKAVQAKMSRKSLKWLKMIASIRRTSPILIRVDSLAPC